MKIGIVVIGRNEGERLEKCLASVVGGAAGSVVYVDSGSTDMSVAIATAMGVAVVILDAGIPFTAARARNEGFRKLLALVPDVTCVQFVDGDCVIIGDWLKTAAAYLDENTDVAVVCGRLRERHPERSVYNLLCDMEWDTPVGAAKACGGIAMMRVAAFSQVGGYRAGLIAGEEPELCIRLRAAGWRVWRLDAEMALHDAEMTRFGQWWRRSIRNGYAFAEGVALHGAPPERHWTRESRRAWFWGGAIPLATFSAVWSWGVPGFALLAFYPLQIIRLALLGGRSARENWWRAFFLVIGKFPEMLGQMKYWWNRICNRTNTLIEYK